MALVTLMYVLKESLTNDRLRSELLSNHHDALKDNHFELSTEDMKLLDGFMSGEHVVDPASVLNSFSNIIKGTAPPPPPPWQPRLPLDEPTT